MSDHRSAGSTRVPASARKAAVVATLALGVATVVLAQQPAPLAGKSEISDVDRSWPHEVRAAADICGGKSMVVLLTEIHDKAMEAWAAAPANPPEGRMAIRGVVTKTLTCLAYDGNVSGDPAAAHAAAVAPGPAHVLAKAKVIAAWTAAFPTPPVMPDWAAVGTELDHGH